jgi:hypothetical protein
MSYRFESVSIPGGGSYSKKRLRLRLSRVLTDGKLDFAGDRAERGFRTKEYANFLEPRKNITRPDPIGRRTPLVGGDHTLTKPRREMRVSKSRRQK